MKYIIVVVLLILASCNSEKKFDKIQWLEYSDLGQYPKRNGMVNDLLEKHKIKGLSFVQVVELIGEPEKNFTGENNEIYYQILTEYGSDIDPVHTKTLILKLDKDSTITGFKVDEWKK